MVPPYIRNAPLFLAGSGALPAGSEALPAGSKALPTGSDALLPPYKAHPDLSDTLPATPGALYPTSVAPFFLVTVIISYGAAAQSIPN